MAHSTITVGTTDGVMDQIGFPNQWAMQVPTITATVAVFTVQSSGVGTTHYVSSCPMVRSRFHANTMCRQQCTERLVNCSVHTSSVVNAINRWVMLLRCTKYIWKCHVSPVPRVSTVSRVLPVMSICFFSVSLFVLLSFVLPKRIVPSFLVSFPFCVRHSLGRQ